MKENQFMILLNRKFLMRRFVLRHLKPRKSLFTYIVLKQIVEF